MLDLLDPNYSMLHVYTSYCMLLLSMMSCSKSRNPDLCMVHTLLLTKLGLFNHVLLFNIIGCFVFSCATSLDVLFHVYVDEISHFIRNLMYPDLRNKFYIIVIYSHTTQNRIHLTLHSDHDRIFTNHSYLMLSRIYSMFKINVFIILFPLLINYSDMDKYCLSMIQYHLKLNKGGTGTT